MRFASTSKPVEGGDQVNWWYVREREMGGGGIRRRRKGKKGCKKAAQILAGKADREGRKKLKSLSAFIHGTGQLCNAVG